MERQRSRPLIVLADDSATQAQQAAQALESARFRVQLASNGREALEQARRWRPDLIVSDILMPVMDGFALCREVRRDPVLASTPIVLITVTFVDPKDEEFALGLGATRFVIKPANPAELVTHVQEVLAGVNSPKGAATATAEDEQAFLTGYGERLAAKLEAKVAELEHLNRRLAQQNQETAVARDRLALLLETSRLVVSSLDLDSVLSRLAEQMVETLQVTFCRISLLDAAGERVVTGAAHPIRHLDWQPELGRSLSLAAAPVCRTVLASGRSELVRLDGDDSPMSAAERAAAGLVTAQSALLVPIMAGEQPTGLICLGEHRSWERSPITAGTVDLAQAMADQVAVAIQNARLQAAQLAAEREARAQEVQALYEATKQITTSLDLTTTLNSILDAVVRLSESEVAGVALLDSGGTTLRYEAVRGPQAQPGHSASFELGAGMIGLAVQHGEVLKLDDMPDEQRWLYRTVTPESGIRSALFVPLRSGERVIGVLAALNRQRAHFTSVRERLLIGLAEQATLAIIHASEINERKRVATELERQYHEAEHARSELRAILDATNEAIILISPTRLILMVNRRFEELFGISAAAMLGRAFGDLQAQVERVFADPARFREQVAGSAPDSEKQFTALVRQRWPQPRDLALFSAPVRDLRDEHIGRLYLFRDVTRERELERVKEEVLQVVNHELRTPLSSLLGFTELLLSRHYSADQQREFLTIIHEEGQRLTTLINDFLNLQRLESGVQQIKPVPTALRPLLERAVVAVGPDPARPVVVDVADDLPPVLIDPDRVHQVLANLLSNARKYSPGGGEVRLTAVLAGGEVEVSVQDQGLGIPPEALPQLFRKFYRVDSSDRRSIKGTGLGLAIVKQIVEEHGGRIWVESGGPGQGSRFSFTLLVAELG